jgi:hypothetical protein
LLPDSDAEAMLEVAKGTITSAQTSAAFMPNDFFECLLIRLTFLLVKNVEIQLRATTLAIDAVKTKHSVNLEI